MTKGTPKPYKRTVSNSKLRFLDPVLISVAEFARLSGLGYSFVRALVTDGTLPVRTIKGRVWIIRAPALRWLLGQDVAEPTRECPVKQHAKEMTNGLV